MPRAYSMEKRDRLRSDTRNRIVGAATALVIARAGTDLTMAEVAEHADVAVRTVYNHFGSVDDLLAAAMDAITAEFAEMAPEPVAAKSSRTALRVLLEQWFAELAKNEAALAAVLSLRGSAQLDHALAEARALRRERLRAVLSMARREDALAAPLDDAVAAAYLLTSYQSWTALVRQLGYDADAAVDLVYRLILAAVFVPESP